MAACSRCCCGWATGHWHPRRCRYLLLHSLLAGMMLHLRSRHTHVSLLRVAWKLADPWCEAATAHLVPRVLQTPGACTGYCAMI